MFLRPYSATVYNYMCQCHEMVIEMSPWPKLMYVNLFFCLKIGRFNVKVHRCKTGSSDPTDFATTRILLPRLWHIGAYRAKSLGKNGSRTLV
jgi:hypothetical protein